MVAFALTSPPVSILLYAQEKIDETADARMRSEELEHSKIMHTLHMLTDRYGPQRYGGTPNHRVGRQMGGCRDDCLGYEEWPSGTLGSLGTRGG